MTVTTELRSDLERLHALEAEHRLTLRVLAVAIEQLLRATGSELIYISSVAVRDAHALTAWRDKQSDDFVLTVAP